MAKIKVSRDEVAYLTAPKQMGGKGLTITRSAKNRAKVITALAEYRGLRPDKLLTELALSGQIEETESEKISKLID